MVTSRHRHVVAAAYLGWTLDAFDFFIMVFVLRNIAQTFSTTITAVTVAITLPSQCGLWAPGYSGGLPTGSAGAPH